MLWTQASTLKEGDHIELKPGYPLICLPDGAARPEAGAAPRDRIVVVELVGMAQASIDPPATWLKNESCADDLYVLVACRTGMTFYWMRVEHVRKVPDLELLARSWTAG